MARFQAAGGGGVPSGTIAMWSGAIGDIPSGWTLCDGTDGAPDLTDSFVKGAGGSESPGDTGGASEVTLSESQIPSHNHGSGSYDADSHSHDFTYNSRGDATTDGNTANVTSISSSAFSTSTSTQSSGSLDVSGFSSSTGGDGSHENEPPYYALAYIMAT